VTELSSSIPVQAPSDFAIAFLNTYVADLAHGSAEAVLPLRFELEKLAGLVLERVVTVHVGYEPAPPGGSPSLKISWQAEDSPMFPRFDGTLTSAPEGNHACILTIDGTYAVPLGVVGLFFDAILGQRVARGTIDGLLRQFREAIEADYAQRMRYSR
jgi:hypothetical protein